MDEVIDQSLKENQQTPGNDESLEWYENRLGQLDILTMYCLFAQRLLDGVLNHFAECCGGTKIVSMFKMVYEFLSNCVKVSSALVPRIKSDRFLNEEGLSNKTDIRKKVWSFSRRYHDGHRNSSAP